MPLLIANAINIGADLGAMADASRLVLGGPQVLYVLLFAVICIASGLPAVHPLRLGLEMVDAVSVRLRCHADHGVGVVDRGS
jgi:hypothetical protein